MLQRYVVLAFLASLVLVACRGSDHDSGSPAASRSEQPAVLLGGLSSDAPVIDPRQLFLVSTEGGDPTLISSTGAFPRVIWSPGGDRFAVVTTRTVPQGRIEVVTANSLDTKTIDGSGDVRSLVWSPDGTRLAFTQLSEGEMSLFVVNSDGSGLSELASEPESYPPPLEIVGWVGDTDLLAKHGSQADLVVYDVQNGRSRGLVNGGFDYGGLSISPSLREVVWNDHCGYRGAIDGLWMAAIESGKITKLSDRCSTGSFAWSADGDEMAYTYIDLVGDDGGIYVIDLNTLAERRVTNPEEGVDVSVSWLPDGEGFLVYRDFYYNCDHCTPPSPVEVSMDGRLESFVAEDDVAVRPAVKANADDGVEYWSEDGVVRVLAPPDADWDYLRAELSPDGRWVTFVRYPSAAVWRQFQIDVADSTVRHVGDVPPDSYASRDGRTLAVKFVPEDGGESTLKLADADGLGEVLIDVRLPSYLRWSPDGSRLIFEAVTKQQDADSIRGTFVIDADGTGLRELPPPLEGARSISWSPDGENIAFVGNGFGRDLWVMEVATGESQAIAANGDRLAETAWSEDRKTIAFGTSDGVAVVAASGEGLKGLKEPVCDDHFGVSSDGQRLALTCSGDSGSVVVVDVDVGSETFTTPILGGLGSSDVPIWSPDDRLIAVHIGGGPDGTGIYIVDPDRSEANLLVRTTGRIVELRWIDDKTIHLVTDAARFAG